MRREESRRRPAPTPGEASACSPRSGSRLRLTTAGRSGVRRHVMTDGTLEIDERLSAGQGSPAGRTTATHSWSYCAGAAVTRCGRL
jgi:hypothetical protein